MSPELIARLIREVERLDYVKEETVPPGSAIMAILQLAGEHCKGVMGGMGGYNLMDEHRRGSCGALVSCHIIEAIIALWNSLESGHEDEARSIWKRLLPVSHLEHHHGTHVYKTVLCQRGVISYPYVRVHRPPLDSYALQELDAAISDIDDLLTCRKYRYGI